MGKFHQCVSVNHSLFSNSSLPGKIDNSLIAHMYKTNPSAIINNEDFFLMPYQIWKFFLNNYGGGPEVK